MLSSLALTVGMTVAQTSPAQISAAQTSPAQTSVAQTSSTQDSARAPAPDDLVPQSPEAWAYVAAAGKADIGSVYDVTENGLVCKHKTEKAVRAKVFDAIAVSAERRAAEGGDPLKIER